MSLRRPHVLLARAPLRQLQPAYQCKRFPASLRDAPAASRSFTSSGRNAATDKSTAALAMHRKRPARQSFRTVQSAEQLNVNDFGLFPDTFVRPTGLKMPSVFQNPRLRLKIETKWAWSKFRNFVSLIIWKFSKKPRAPWERKAIRSRASTLYIRLYSALARHDMTTLKEICGDGLLESCRSIHSLDRDKVQFWGKLKNNSRPRIVSDLTRRMPVPDAPANKPCLMRQVVVRLNTRQFLIRTRKEGNDLVDVETGKVVDTCYRGNIRLLTNQEKTAAAMDVVEYVVVQKRIWMGEEEPWMVWGMTKETELKDVSKKSKALELLKGNSAAKA